MRNLLAILVGLFLLLMIEGLLLLFGVPTLNQEDPFVGFSGSAPLFIPVSGETSYELNPVKKNYFNPQTFLAPKPEQTFRIISFGGSTTYGRPYLDGTSFSAWFDRLLERYTPNQSFRHVNAGGISYASYRSLRLMDELSRFEPDLYIVYSGHNEFLEERTFTRIKEEASGLRQLRSLLHRSRIYSSLNRGLGGLIHGEKTEKIILGDEVAARLEQIGGPDLYHRDPAFKQGVLRQYRYTIEKMVDLAAAKKIPLILCTLPTNLSGVSPFKSEHRPDLSAEEWWAWQRSFKQAEKFIVAHQYPEALKALEEADVIDSQFALLHYRKGQVLQALGRPSEALLSYIKAKEEDIVPLRALDEFNNILREISSSRNVPLADIEAVFRRVSPDGIPGNNLFADHVHPTIEGQQLAAWVILDTAVKYDLVPLSLDQWQRNVNDARAYLRAESEAISPRYRAMGMWGVGRLYFWAGKYPEAYQTLLKAWREVKDVPEIPLELGIIDSSLGHGEKALRFLLLADKMSAGNPSIQLPLANAYTLTGQSQTALVILDRLGPALDGTAAYHYARGKALLQLGEQADGRVEIEKAVNLAPDAAEYHADLAKVLAMTGDGGRAEEEYRVYLQLIRHPDPQQALTRWKKGLESDAPTSGDSQ